MNNFETALEKSKLTRSMWLLWILSAGLIALDGFDFFIIGIALPFIKQDFHLSTTEVGEVAVAAIVGALLGSLILGPLTDKIGRQKMLIIDVLIFLIASIGTALAWDGYSLIFFRFLIGVGIGADYPITVAYITENVPSRFRGKMVIGAFTFQAVGALLGALTGIIVIELCQIFFPNNSLFPIQYGWRLMLSIGLFLAILIGFLRLIFLLESPHYHIVRGEYEEAQLAARKLLEQQINITPESDPQPYVQKLSYTALFLPQYLKNTLLASLPWFIQDIATYGIGIFTPTIIATLAFQAQDNFLLRQIHSAQGSALVDIFLIIGFLIAVLLVDQVGRFFLQISGFIGMAIGLYLLAISGDNNSFNTGNLTLIFTGFFWFNLFMNAGPNATTFLLSGEVFPPAIRASGAGLSAGIAKMGAVVGVFFLPILQEKLGLSVLLYGLVAFCVLAAILTYLLKVDLKSEKQS